MSRYFTSDWHINSTNILKYANRPYKSWQSAAISLIEQCNAVASKNDCVFHVGDLIMLSNDRHDTIEDVLDANAYTLKDIKQRITANFITIEGNHDDGHSFEADCKSMVLDLNQNYRNVYVSHFPSDHKDYHGPYCKAKTKVVLCGHVHDAWLLKYDALKNVLNINVGTDVWGFKPVRDAKITEMLDYVFKHQDFKFSWQQTRKEFDEWKKNNDLHVAALREQRKAEKRAKQGLTPEECERRKIEAMKKKGLI